MQNRIHSVSKSSLALALAAAVFLGGCTEGPGDNPKASDQGQTDVAVQGVAPPIEDKNCVINDDEKQLQALVDKHRDRRFSAGSMACAARAAMAYYDNNMLSPEALNQAAEAASNYAEYTHNVKLMDLMGANQSNNRAIEEAMDLERRVLNILGKIPFAGADVKAWRGLMMIQLLQAEGGSDLDAALEARALIEEAVAEDEQVLNGLALSILGRIYYELPVVLGGDNLKSIVLLERSLKLNPSLMPTLQFLAESYDQELEEQKSKQTLGLMLTLKPQIDTEQEIVDGLRIGAGLARRLGDKSLAQKLSKMRQSVLAGNSKLLTRESESMGGHGGVNPLTGV